MLSAKIMRECSTHCPSELIQFFTPTAHNEHPLAPLKKVLMDMKRSQNVDQNEVRVQVIRVLVNLVENDTYVSPP